MPQRKKEKVTSIGQRNTISKMPAVPICCIRKDNFYMNEKKNRNYTVKENGNIVVHNYCAAALPKITVTIHSGQTTYRFNGSYDGTRSLSGKLLDHMAKDN